jgi:DNA gyrase inhibitor GyrI
MMSDSDTAFVRLREWVANCVNNHEACRTKHNGSAILPTRVLDVQTNTGNVSLVQNPSGPASYVALSHCWGNRERLMLTKKTVQLLENGTSIDTLPKTFQDAITITQRLGIKYLWIDCLCIFQDDPTDWEKEASRMSTVYRNAYVTISAAGSTDSFSGCFPAREKDAHLGNATASLGYTHDREATGPKSAVLAFAQKSRPDRMMRLHLFEEWLPGSSMYEPQKRTIGTFGKYFDPVADQALSKRGWTLQERLLSPRVIHYGTDQMYYECGE